MHRTQGWRIPIVNQSEMVRLLAGKHDGVTVREMHRSVSKLVEYMTQGLLDGCRFEIRGFGVLQHRENAPRRSRDPRNGDSIWIEGRRYGHFKPSRLLRQALNRT